MDRYFCTAPRSYVNQGELESSVRGGRLTWIPSWAAPDFFSWRAKGVKGQGRPVSGSKSEIKRAANCGSESERNFLNEQVRILPSHTN